MLKFNSTVHLLIIISMLFVGVASAHICLDDGTENNTSISLMPDQSDDNSSSDIAFDCCESSCHHGCNHIFTLNQNVISELSDFAGIGLIDYYNYPLPLKHVFLPSKPPKA